jgi:Prp8 binding protein
VLDVHWSADDEHILTASSDKTAALFDAFSGTRIKRIKDHSSYVNSCVPSRQGDRSMMLTASDDCTARLYDVRARACVHKFDCEFPVLSADFAVDNSRIFTAGIEESIRVWDLRMNSVVMTLDGHMDTVTGTHYFFISI